MKMQSRLLQRTAFLPVTAVHKNLREARKLLYVSLSRKPGHSFLSSPSAFCCPLLIHENELTSKYTLCYQTIHKRILYLFASKLLHGCEVNQSLKAPFSVHLKSFHSSNDVIGNISRNNNYSQSDVDNLATCVAFLFVAFVLLYLTGDDVLTSIKVAQCSSSLPKEAVDKHVNHQDSAVDLKRKKNGESISLKEAIEKSHILCERKKAEVGSPGLVVCVSVDGKQVYAKGFGYADLENEVPIRPNSALRIASISKSVTAVMVAKLWEDGRIDLDQRVQHYLPDFPQKYYMNEKVDIKVSQLLNHTSGIRHYKNGNDPAYTLDEQVVELVKKTREASLLPFYAAGAVTKKNQSLPHQREAKMPFDALQNKKDKEIFSKENFPTTTKALTLFQNDPLVCKPGSKYVYTTHGFTVLSAIVESVSGGTFPEMVTKTLHSMGMKESYLDKHGPLVYNRARYYMKDKAGKVVNTPYVDCSYKWGGGGLLSTSEDLIRFGNILLYSAQHEDGDPGPPGYLKASTVWKFWCPPGDDKTVTPRYGLGFELTPDEQFYGMCGRYTFGAGHTGGAVGASSILFILPRCSEGGMSDPSASSNQSCPAGNGEQKTAMKLKCGSTLQNKEAGLPQGVVVAVIVNLSSVSVRSLSQEIARTFEKVDFSL